MNTVVGVLHPGEMGSSIGAAARMAGADVCWASDGRSDATRMRAEADDLRDVGTLSALTATATAIFSVCPPGGALALAHQVFALGYSGIYVDANAVNPATVGAIAQAAEGVGALFVDGGIVGPPARSAGTTVLYLSGGPAERVASLFEGSSLEVLTLRGPAGQASALKMAYAAYTKGSSALLLAVRALARAHDVEAPLLAHWARTHPHLEALSEGTARATAPKAWRFSAEMEEIAATFDGAGLPTGFHQAAAELYARLADLKHVPDADLARVLECLVGPGRDPRASDGG